MTNTDLSPQELSFLFILALNSIEADYTGLEAQMDAIDSLLSLNGLGPYSDFDIDEDGKPIGVSIEPEDFDLILNRVSDPLSPIPFFIKWWLTNDKPLSAEELATIIKIVL